MLTRLFDRIFSEKFKKQFETVVIWAAMIGFAIHLLLILGIRWDLIELPEALQNQELLKGPISAIYTPFSFILFYEVFLLIYFLPQSFTTAVGKQYEIISLILLRRIFKDIAQIEIGVDWFSRPDNIQLTVDMLGFILVFFIIYQFYVQVDKNVKRDHTRDVTEFIRFKKGLSLTLFVVFIGLSIYDFIHFGHQTVIALTGGDAVSFDLNTIFYNEFFTTLILADVFLLLFSYRFTKEYSLLVRNSGFVITTVLIRLSFEDIGIVNTALIIFAIMFGWATQRIYRSFTHQKEREI